MNAENIIKTALDGSFFFIDFDGRTRVKPVTDDYMPDHRPKYGLLEEEEGPHHNALPFSLEQDEKLITLRESGLPWRYVARAVGRCTNTSRERYVALCAERGIEPVSCARAHKSKFPAELKLKIAELRKKRFPWDIIASQLGMAKQEVQSAYQTYCRANRRAAQ